MTVDFIIITEPAQSTIAPSDQISSKNYQEFSIEKRVYPSEDKNQVLYSVIIKENLFIELFSATYRKYYKKLQ